jgi:hypothetical protein
VAAAERKLICLKLKSCPPKNLSVVEVAASFDHLKLPQPDTGSLVVNTALHLSDEILPMLIAEMERRRRWPETPPERVERELWARTPRLYAVSGRRDLMANVGRAIADGLRAPVPAVF